MLDSKIPDRNQLQLRHVITRNLIAKIIQPKKLKLVLRVATQVEVLRDIEQILK
jgi:hypothetical protein